MPVFLMWKIVICKGAFSFWQLSCIIRSHASIKMRKKCEEASLSPTTYSQGLVICLDYNIALKLKCKEGPKILSHFQIKKIEKLLIFFLNMYNVIARSE